MILFYRGGILFTLKIKSLRIDHDLTQQNVADKLNINRRTYSNYENGINEIPYEILFKLAIFYDVSLEYLLGLTKRKKRILKSKNFSYTKLLSNLISLRLTNNYMQSDISKIIICNRNTFTQYETGKRKIPIDVLIKLSRIYNTTVDNLFFDINSKDILEHSVQKVKQ